MHRLYVPVSVEQQRVLLDIKAKVSFQEAYAARRRMGENGINALSAYRDSRWHEWTQQEHNLFKAQLPRKQVDKSLIGWFLELLPETGFLDRMTTWVNKPDAGTVIAYALGGDQVIYLNDQPVEVKARQGIGFSLRTVHELKPSAAGQLWACLMVKGDFNLFA